MKRCVSSKVWIRLHREVHCNTNFMAQYLLDSFSSVKYIVLAALTLKKWFLKNKCLQYKSSPSGCLPCYNIADIMHF